MSNHTTKKRIVDIYFVLYLAALILLLPVKEENQIISNDITNPIFQQDFYIYSDKSVLNCWLKIDSNGISIVSIDSVNTLFCSGNIKDLKFDFVVENQSLLQQLKLNPGQSNYSRFFWYEEDIKNKSATFYWKPPINDFINKSYRVYVTATAQPVKYNSNDKANTVTDGKTLTARTEFSLNVIFLDRIDQQTGISSNLMDSATGLIPDLTTYPTQIDLQNIDLMPINSDIKSIANEKWKNDVYVSIPQISQYFEYPKINIIRNPENNGGSAAFSELSNNIIKLTGRTPYSGFMKVEVILVSRQSRQKFITEFRVTPQPIGEPEFDRVMHPDVNHKIITKLPAFADIDAKVIIREKSTNIERVISQSGNDFYFTPGFEDIGKFFYLERYINGNLYGQKYLIEVKDFAQPVIIKLTSGDNKVKIETRSFGTFMGRENLIVNLDIQGNGKYREDFGKPTEGKDKLSFTQYFYITPKYNDKPFNFSVRAIDMRGRSSEIKNYP